MIKGETWDCCSASNSCDFLQDLIDAVPYTIHTVLTDNGNQFITPGNRRLQHPILSRRLNPEEFSVLMPLSCFVRYPYVYLDGIWLKRNWGGAIKNVSVLAVVDVTGDGYREIIGAAEREKEDKAGWQAFLWQLKKRGLKEVRMIISDKCLGLVESVAEVFPNADWQRCIVHWCRNIFKDVPRQKIRVVAAMLKAIRAQEDRKAALEKAQAVVKKLKEMKLHKEAEHVRESVAETLGYMSYPEEHWRKIRTNNPLERIMKEIRRRTRRAFRPAFTLAKGGVLCNL